MLTSVPILDELSSGGVWGVGMFHYIMEHLLLVERGEGHVTIVNVVYVVVELGNEERNILSVWFVVHYIENRYLIASSGIVMYMYSSESRR